jgi:hypothetical protein
VSPPTGCQPTGKETSGVAATIAVGGWTLALDRIRKEPPGGVGQGVLGGGASARPGQHRRPVPPGDITEALSRELPAAADVLDRLAIDLAVDPNTITAAWFVATAFPPPTRPPSLPWATYLILRLHPERHELVDRAASAGWDQARLQQELSARFAAHHRSPPDQSA